MKKRRTLLTLTAILGCFGLLASCNNGEEPSSPISGDSQTTQDGSSNTGTGGGTTTGDKTLVGAYTSPAELVYRNMRPTYNYYMTYFNFESLELFSDYTYALSYSSMMFSAVVLPDVGSDATSNERDNTVETYYGTYESVVNDLDEDSLDITLSIPNRVVVSYDSKYFIDTAQWTDAMADAVAVKDADGNVTKSFTAESYLASKAFHEKTILASKSNYSFDFFELRGADEADPDVTVSTDTQGLVAAYLTPAKFFYQNMRPNFNYYITSFTQQQLLVYSDNTYEMNVFSSQFSGLILPEEGSNASGSERVNYVQKFNGDCTSQTDDLDEDSLDISLSAPERARIYFNSLYYLDTENWTEEMTEKTNTTNEDQTVTVNYPDGESYLKAVAFDAQEILASKTNYSFDYIDDLVAPILV